MISDFWRYKGIVISGSIIDVLGWLFYAIALKEKELAIVTAITESYPALTLFYGVKFNQEKISRWQYIGAVLTLGGSLILVLIS